MAKISRKIYKAAIKSNTMGTITIPPMYANSKIDIESSETLPISGLDKAVESICKRIILIDI